MGSRIFNAHPPPPPWPTCCPSRKSNGGKEVALPSKCPPFLPNTLHRLLEETYQEPLFAKWCEPQQSGTALSRCLENRGRLKQCLFIMHRRHPLAANGPNNIFQKKYRDITRLASSPRATSSTWPTETVCVVTVGYRDGVLLI